MGIKRVDHDAPVSVIWVMPIVRVLIASPMACWNWLISPPGPLGDGVGGV